MEFEEVGVRVNIEENVLPRDIRDAGFASGLAEGEAKGKLQLLIRQLNRRFGELPKWAQLRLAKAGPGQIERWGDALLTASTLEGVIGRR